jgi:hypothetical protein
MATFLLLLMLALACGLEEDSHEMRQMRARQQQAIDNINSIKAEAVKDDNGMVTPQEYGRLLRKIAETTAGYSGLRPLPELIDEYVAGLEGPVDPEEMTKDMSMGGFSQILLKAVNMELTRMKSEL